MSMGDKFDKLFEKLKQEFQKQTIDITDNLISNLSKTIDEKIRPIYEENTLLSEEIGKLQKRIEYLERDSKRNNVIMFNVEEVEENVSDLLHKVQKKIIDDLNISLEKSEINNVYRVGRRIKENAKPRPIVVSFVNAWKRDEVLRNKKKFQIARVCEDFPKSVIEKRKMWKLEIKDEMSKGNVAYLVYDKLLVKPKTVKKEEGNKPMSDSNSYKTEKTKVNDINKLFDESIHANMFDEMNVLVHNSSFWEEVQKNKKEFDFKPVKRRIPSHYVN